MYITEIFPVVRTRTRGPLSVSLKIQGMFEEQAGEPSLPLANTGVVRLRREKADLQLNSGR